MDRESLRFMPRLLVMAGILACSLPGAARAADLASIVDDAAWGWSDLGMQLGLLVVAFLVLGAMVTLLDLRHQRAEEARTLRIRVAERELARDPHDSRLEVDPRELAPAA